MQNVCTCGSLLACRLLFGVGYYRWVLDMKPWIMKIVDNVLNDLSRGCTLELMKDLDATWDSWIDHHYACGNSELAMTCQDVKCVLRFLGSVYRITVNPSKKHKK